MQKAKTKVRVVEPTRGEVHSPCAHNPHGAHKAMCIRLSGIPIKAVACEDSKCTSKWRVDLRSLNSNPQLSRGHTPGAKEFQKMPPSRRSRVQQKNPVPAPPSPMKATQQKVGRPKAKSLPNSVKDAGENSDEWRGVLERVKKAMAGSALITLDPNRIRPMEGQPRSYFNEATLAQLRRSIQQVGQIQAGIVRAVRDNTDGITHELLDGERRWRVACLENISFRAQLVQIDDVAAPYMVGAIANFNREGHTAMEISDAIHKLKMGEIKVPMEAIAEIFGFGINWTYHMHGLQNLNPEVRGMLDPNQHAGNQKKLLSVVAAIHISKLDKELQTDVAQKVLDKEISLQRLRRTIIEVGEAHNKPVRTREIEPRKIVASLKNKCEVSSRIAEDMLAQINELRTRGILKGLSSLQKEEMTDSLEKAIRNLSRIRDALNQ